MADPRLPLPRPTPRERGFTWPAEWERHEGTWLAWPHDPRTWPDCVPEAESAFASLTRDLEILLDCGYVHGDLSPYNVLYLDGAARMIDLPQAVRIDETPDAWTLFHRDVDNLTRYFTRNGVMSDPIDLAIRLWR